MVFYEIVITKGNPPGSNTIIFQNGIDTYESNTNSGFIATQFLFQSFADGTGNLLASDTIINDSLWVKNGYNFNLTAFPSDDIKFQPGDCIHIINGTFLGFSATIVIRNSSGTIVQTEILDLTEEKWILWNGNNSRLSSQPCCVHPNTKVLTKRGPIKICEIRKGDKVINHAGKALEVISNIRSIPSRDFIKISANALGKVQPSQELLIRAGHPILLNGKEVDPNTLIKRENICKTQLDKAENVWTLCTVEREFVWMNGVPVCTWNHEDWKRHAEKHAIVYTEF